MSTVRTRTGIHARWCLRFRLHAHRAQSLVEFGLMLPLLLLILLGTLDLGRVFFASITVTNAAREGARYAAMYPTDATGIRSHATREATGTGITLANVTVDCPGGSCAGGQPIRVSVESQFRFITAFMMGGGLIPLRASSQFSILAP